MYKFFEKTDKSLEHFSNDDKLRLYEELLDAIWTMRWTDNKESMYAVLTEEEADKISIDIINNLHKNGFKIIKNE